MPRLAPKNRLRKSNIGMLSFGVQKVPWYKTYCTRNQINFDESED